MISRELAIDTLEEILDSDILKEEYEDALQGIISCLEAELIGRHEWGVPDEKLGTLYVAKRADLITDKDIEEYEQLHKSIIFEPSEFEKDHIRENVMEHIEDHTDEDVTDADVDYWFDRN